VAGEDASGDEPRRAISAVPLKKDAEQEREVRRENVNAVAGSKDRTACDASGVEDAVDEEGEHISGKPENEDVCSGGDANPGRES
jgi:hypothetical protein